MLGAARGFALPQSEANQSSSREIGQREEQAGQTEQMPVARSVQPHAGNTPTVHMMLLWTTPMTDYAISGFGEGARVYKGTLLSKHEDGLLRDIQN